MCPAASATLMVEITDVPGTEPDEIKIFAIFRTLILYALQFPQLTKKHCECLIEQDRCSHTEQYVLAIKNSIFSQAKQKQLVKPAVNAT